MKHKINYIYVFCTKDMIFFYQLYEFVHACTSNLTNIHPFLELRVCVCVIELRPYGQH